MKTLSCILEDPAVAELPMETTEKTGQPDYGGTTTGNLSFSPAATEPMAPRHCQQRRCMDAAETAETAAEAAEAAGASTIGTMYITR